MKYNFIIVGAGVSGLTLSCLLQQQGHSVLLLEKNPISGGMLQSFHRSQQRFDSCVHYVGALGPNQTLATYFHALGILDRLQLQPLNPQGFDEYRFPTFSFRVPTGLDAYRDRLLEHFPDEANAILAFTTRLQQTCAQIPIYNPHLLQKQGRNYIQPETLGQYLDQLGVSEDLRAVLTAPLYLYNVLPHECPLHLHFLVLDSFLQSAWRFEGGSQHLADVLTERFQELGGTLQLHAHVEQLHAEQRTVQSVQLTDGSTYFAERFIAAVHPKTCLQWLPSNALRKSYRQRIQQAPDGLGAFGFFCKLPAQENWTHNVYWFDHTDTTRAYHASFPTLSKTIHTNPSTTIHAPHQLHWRPSMMFLTCDHGSLQGFVPMRYQDALAWCGEAKYGRSPQYHRTKRHYLRQLQRHLQTLFPELPIAQAPAWSGTPLTYERYTATHHGASYGILQRQHLPPILPRTNLRNLYLTGQSTLLPGIVGATLSAILTACEILDWDFLSSFLSTHKPN